MDHLDASVSLIAARHRLGTHVPAATTTHAKTKELLDTVFSMRSVSYQYSIFSERNVGS
jgi:hypothetical protein